MPVGYHQINRFSGKNLKCLLDCFCLRELADTKPPAQIFDNGTHELIVVDNKNAQRLELWTANHCASEIPAFQAASWVAPSGPS